MQGWDRFCWVEVPAYPMLVRFFFENMRIGAMTISSIVKETLIVLDERQIGNILEMPRIRIFFYLIEKNR